MAADDGDGAPRGERRKSFFSWSETSDESSGCLRRYDVPADVSREIDARVGKKGEDALLPRLCAILQSEDRDKLAEKVTVLAAITLDAADLYKMSASIKLRLQRIQTFLTSIASAERSFRLFEESIKDDIEFARSPAGIALLDYFRAGLAAQGHLEAEAARLNDRGSGLKAPAKGNHARVVITQTQCFLGYAGILWFEETGAPPQEFSDGYVEYLQLLWEIITGEPHRSFAKAIRAGRTRHGR